ncbi:MAG: phytanoyl-CoA dioxygenase family protein [Fimbriimonadaceae bacterium]|nr:phytanoyl-CoA dioxygenase family protein [Fimbriimonadaceae bacterium]
MNLTTEQVEQWRAQGYLHLPAVFTAAEVAAMHAECDRLLASELVHDDNLRTRFRGHPTLGKVVEKFDPVTDVSPVFAAVAQDPRILDPLRRLYDDEPLLFKDKVIFKPPGAAGYAVHQDWTWWQVFPPQNLASVMVAIDAADAANGVLELAPGRHQRPLTPIGELRSLTDAEVAALGLEWVPVETQPGDILIFHCLAPHRSGVNTSTRSRRQFYPTYSAGCHGDLWAAHYEHYRWYVERGLSEAERERLFLK